MRRQVRSRPRNRNRHGTAMVEFAIVLPLLTLMVFGIIELGGAWHRKQVAATAAREGARTGAIYNTTHTRDTVVTTVQHYLQVGNTDTAKVLIWTNCCNNGENWDSVTITDTLKFPMLSKLSPLPAKRAVTATAVYKRE